MLETNIIHLTDCRNGFSKEELQNSVDLIVTSPPYGVGIKYDSWDDNNEKEAYFNFAKEWLQGAYNVLKDDGRIAINIPYEINMKDRGGRVFIVSKYYQLMEELGFGFAGIIDLHEDNPHRTKLTAFGSWASSSAPYIYNPKECVIIGYKKQWKKLNKGKSFNKDLEEDKKEFMKLVSGIWEYRAETRKLTEANFSLDIPEKAIKILSYEEDIILDPFMGSGTTAIASIKTNRKYIGFEISENYREKALNRIENYKLTGKH
jgi:site-specific DNA-methyltransferase (adenine-specific)